MKKLYFFYFLVTFLFIFSKSIFAQGKNNLTTNQFVTIVNPVRISSYSKDPKRSLTAQYLAVHKRGLVATWLFTYDVISDPGIISMVQRMDNSQELGLFLEVTPKYASESGVVYNKTDSWHRSNSVFLSGYTQEDRIKLIDKIFEEFKKIFAYYPKSVGAWWVDSYSLDYMQKKYGIIANLTVADQFETDGYQIWGTPWSVPFYPNKIHSGVPAQSTDSKLDIVTIQWAARDPLNGYGRGPASLFSTQDYHKTEYFQKLIDLYARSHGNRFGQITVGLEGDFPPDSYGDDSFFTKQLDVVKDQKQRDFVNVVTMKDFSDWYKSSFPSVSPVQIIESDDFLGKRVKSIWYNSPNFRVNIVYDFDTKETKIRDFRAYHSNFQEPYYISPNRDLNLYINLPSQIDFASNPKEEWKLFTRELERIDSSDQTLLLKYKGNTQIKLIEDRIEILGDIKNIPNVFTNSLLINFRRIGKNNSIQPKTEFNFPKEGLIFRSLTQEGTFFLKQRKVITLVILIILFYCIIFLLILKRKQSLISKILVISGLAVLIIGGGFRWYLLNSRLYFVNQSELDALNRLRLMPGEKIVVYDQVCLQCSWHTLNIPAIFANKRQYVAKITGKKIIYNSSIFNAKTRPEAKAELNTLHADYIYLVRFEDYRELAPFSPGDLNIEEIYSNANAQIWKVKKS